MPCASDSPSDETKGGVGEKNPGGGTSRAWTYFDDLPNPNQNRNCPDTFAENPDSRSSKGPAAPMNR